VALSVSEKSPPLLAHKPPGVKVWIQVASPGWAAAPPPPKATEPASPHSRTARRMSTGSAPATVMRMCSVSVAPVTVAPAGTAPATSNSSSARLRLVVAMEPARPAMKKSPAPLLRPPPASWKIVLSLVGSSTTWPLPAVAMDESSETAASAARGRGVMGFLMSAVPKGGGGF